MSERSKKLVTLALNKELALKMSLLRAKKYQQVNKNINDNNSEDPDFIPGQESKKIQIKPECGKKISNIIIYK